MHRTNPSELPLIVESQQAVRALVLNRPQALNSLTLEVIRALRRALGEALADPEVRLVALWGAGDKGFCAGGDVKALTNLVRERNFQRAEAFFREEYALDLFIHRYPKALLVLADGVVMGGGLGLAAGADLVVATERTRMAMPETRIGFFPDVGATGWLSAKCPPGYPECLGLTGYEIRGSEAVRLGLATQITAAARLPALKEALADGAAGLPLAKGPAIAQLQQCLAPFFPKEIPASPALDRQVARHFAGKATVREIKASLAAAAPTDAFCQEALKALEERSPTALVLTLRLLRENRGRPLPEVFDAEWRAASFMIRHPDYLEGVRARVIDKDDRPVWRPASLEEVRLDELQTLHPEP